MNFRILAAVVLGLSSANACAEFRPYVGASLNIFGISSSGIKVSNTNNGASFSSSEDARDTGSVVGFSGGVMINEHGKINFSYLSGKEDDSEILTLTTTSLSYDYSFSSGHRGWFMGAGLSSVDIEMDATSVTQAGSDSATGLLLRGGYEYLFKNNLLLELGVDKHFAKIDMKNEGRGLAVGIDLESEMEASNVYASLSYVF